MAYHGILQSTGKYSITLMALVAGLITKGFGNIVFIPMFQTLGASIATILGLFVMLGMIWILSGEGKSSSNHQKSTMIKLGIVSIGMAIVVGGLNILFGRYFPAGDSRTKDTLLVRIVSECWNHCIYNRSDSDKVIYHSRMVNDSKREITIKIYKKMEEKRGKE